MCQLKGALNWIENLFLLRDCSVTLDSWDYMQFCFVKPMYFFFVYCHFVLPSFVIVLVLSFVLVFSFFFFWSVWGRV